MYIDLIDIIDIADIVDMQLPEAARLVEQDGVGGEGGAGRACAQQPGQHARAPGLQRGQLLHEHGHLDQSELSIETCVSQSQLTLSSVSASSRATASVSPPALCSTAPTLSLSTAPACATQASAPASSTDRGWRLATRCSHSYGVTTSAMMFAALLCCSNIFSHSQIIFLGQKIFRENLQ